MYEVIINQCRRITINLFRTLVLNNILFKINTDLFVFSPFAGSGIYITRSGPEEIAANAFSNITLSCLVSRIVAKLDDLRVTWNFKNQSDPLKTGGKYRIPELEPITSCRRAFKLEIINVKADDEGVYSCHQSCKDSFDDLCKSSAQLELKVYSPFPTTGEKRLSACRNPKRYSKEFNFVLLLTEEGWPEQPKHSTVAHKYRALHRL